MAELVILCHVQGQTAAKNPDAPPKAKQQRGSSLEHRPDGAAFQGAAADKPAAAQPPTDPSILREVLLAKAAASGANKAAGSLALTSAAPDKVQDQPRPESARPRFGSFPKAGSAAVHSPTSPVKASAAQPAAASAADPKPASAAAARSSVPQAAASKRAGNAGADSQPAPLAVDAPAQPLRQGAATVPRPQQQRPASSAAPVSVPSLTVFEDRAGDRSRQAQAAATAAQPARASASAAAASALPTAAKAAAAAQPASSLPLGMPQESAKPPRKTTGITIHLPGAGKQRCTQRLVGCSHTCRFVSQPWVSVQFGPVGDVSVTS